MKYLRIGDFSKICDVSVKTIRFYEEKGLIKPVFTDKYTGYRYYDVNNIQRILEIVLFRDLGFSLREIKNLNTELIVEKISSLKSKISLIQENILKLESFVQNTADDAKREFINDELVIGKWKHIKSNEDFPFDEIYFLPFGQEYWVFSWTKGYLKINSVYHQYTIENNILELFIKDINGYIGISEKFIKIDSNRYSIDEITLKDDIDYVFVDDSNVISSWVVIDYIYENQFLNYNYETQYNENLYLKSMTFKSNGTVISECNNHIKCCELWTKGKIINNHLFTSSNYIIKHFNNIDYLFVEWKSGDYQFGKRKPDYYVLKRQYQNNFI